MSVLIQLEAERDALRAEVERLRPAAVAHPYAIAEIERLQAEVERLRAELTASNHEVARMGSRAFDLSRKVSELENFLRFIAIGPAHGVPAATVKIGAATWDWIRKEFGREDIPKPPEVTS